MKQNHEYFLGGCLLYTSDAADDTPCVDLGGRRIIKKVDIHAKNKNNLSFENLLKSAMNYLDKGSSNLDR